MEAVKISPQPGPQTAFLSCKADIAIYGGSAGGGKSFALLLEPLYHYNNPKFGAVIFRRNSVQVRNQGGLWDESMPLYSALSGHPREAFLEWEFPSRATVKFAHLEYDKSVYDWQGSQIPLIGFDELTHFTEKQFFYMLSRNRSMSGVPGYVRATCNPDADSWVRKLIDWWIAEDGFPIKERSGVIRYFIRQDDEIVWGDSKEELMQKFGPEQIPKSLTFIPSSIHDNKILMEKDPSYLSSLLALPRVERERLLGGNWNVRASAGMYFRREWFGAPLEKIPTGWRRCVRYWDRAATEPHTANPDPDWTAGCKMYIYPNGTYLIAHMARDRLKPLGVERLVKGIANTDGFSTEIFGEQDPGSAGTADAEAFCRMLGGYIVKTRKVTKNKEVRAKPLSAQCEAGNVFILKGDWNEAFLLELENFPEGAKDDQVDASSGAFNELASAPSLIDVL